jgi:hypothetical protein
MPHVNPAEEHRRAAAWHEAGHVVVGRCFKWWLNPDGVEIDERQCTGLRACQWDYTEHARVIVDCAGWLAEYRFHKLAGPWTEDDVREVIDLLSLGEDPDDDVSHAIEAIREHNPGMADEAVLVRFMEFQRETIALLEQADIWRDFEKVAAALIARGKLSYDDVVALLDAGSTPATDALAKQPPGKAAGRTGDILCVVALGAAEL